MSGQVTAPWIAPYLQGITDTHISEQCQSSSTRHLFGKDDQGRVLSSRILFGARVSLQIGLFAISLSLLVGIPVGLIAGLWGGAVDELVLRSADVVLSFPSLLLAMAISATLGPSLRNAMIAIAVSRWAWHKRLIRSEAMSVKEREFIEATRGYFCARILVRHFLPNSLTSLVAQASIDFGGIVLTSASFSFLRVGAQAPTPEWGLMISPGRTYFLTHWWITVIPEWASSRP